MSSLLEQQDAFVDALFMARPQAAHLRARESIVAEAGWERGLAAYRANGRALAQRALEAAFPVVAELVGAETFEALAHRSWCEDPPSRGDIAQWGAAFAASIAALPDLLADAPYLPDVARLEWALHQAASAADGQADAGSFALLAQQPAEDLVLQIAPGTACIDSPWPIVSIWRAHREDGALLALARDRMAEPHGESALVWRQGMAPRVREALPGEPALIAALKESGSVADALAGAPGFDLGAWLAPAVRDGLLLAIVARHGPSP